MTMAQTADTASAPTRAGQPANWGGIAVGYAREMASDDFRRGDLAELRRMDPDAPDAAVVWRLLARRDLLRGRQVENKWALILHGIALMTPTASGGRPSRSAHDGRIAVGRALYLGGESERASAYYSAPRLSRLLTARDPILRTLLARIFRMLAAADQPFNWWEMASFILNEGYNEEAAEQARATHRPRLLPDRGPEQAFRPGRINNHSEERTGRA